MSTKFKPCPFCGSKNIEGHTDHVAGSWLVCRDCGATGPSDATDHGAADKWEERASDDSAAIAGYAITLELTEAQMEKLRGVMRDHEDAGPTTSSGWQSCALQELADIVDFAIQRAKPTATR